MKTSRTFWLLGVPVLLAVVLAGYNGAATRSTAGAAADAPRNAALKPRAATPRLKKIAWQPTFEAAMEQARKSGKPVMVDFYAQWCGWCKKLDTDVYPKQEVMDESANFVSVKVDTDARNDLMQKYQVSGLPSIVWMRADGSIIDRIDGYADAPEFAQMMRSAAANAQPPAV